MNHKNPRDYFNNASSHVLSKSIISLDIRSFYDNIDEEYVVNIFKYLCKFPDDVSNVLGKLVTYNGKVPQGGVTSSYIANLVFWDKEYKIVDKYRKRGFTYTRLLDDIVISNKKYFTENERTEIIKEIAGLVRSKGLKLNKKKIKNYTNSKPMFVTGLWVNHKKPKCLRSEKKQIRSAVFECEMLYKKKEYYTNNYHELWNSTSGRVAKLARVGHSQSIKLRERLQKIYPKVSDELYYQMETILTNYEKLNKKQRNYPHQIKKINQLKYYCSILGRHDKRKAKKMLKRINSLNILTYAVAEGEIS